MITSRIKFTCQNTNFDKVCPYQSSRLDKHLSDKHHLSKDDIKSSIENSKDDLNHLISSRFYRNVDLEKHFSCFKDQITPKLMQHFDCFLLKKGLINQDLTYPINWQLYLIIKNSEYLCNCNISISSLSCSVSSSSSSSSSSGFNSSSSFSSICYDAAKSNASQSCSSAFSSSTSSTSISSNAYYLTHMRDIDSKHNLELSLKYCLQNYPIARAYKAHILHLKFDYESHEVEPDEPQEISMPDGSTRKLASTPTNGRKLISVCKFIAYSFAWYGPEVSLLYYLKLISFLNLFI